MPIATTPAPSRRTTSALVTGLALSGVLWLFGLDDLAWVGFVVAGLLWASLDTSRATTLLEPRPRGTTSASSTTIPAGSYQVVPAMTQVTLQMQKLRWLTVRATLEKVTARIDVGDEGIERVLGSLPAATFRSGNSRRDAHVLGRDFLNAQQHPDICFVSRTIRRVDQEVSEVVGDLSLIGTKAEVTWRVTSVEADAHRRMIRAHAETSLSRSSLGLTKLRWLVGDEVHAHAVVVATPVADAHDAR